MSLKSSLWELTKKFIEEQGLVRQHINSYNEFIEKGLQEIIDEVGEVPLEVEGYSMKVKLGKIEVGSPKVIEVDGSEREIYPMEARIRNLTYAAPLYLEMSLVVDGRERAPEIVYIGNLPVMLKSKICPLSKMTADELMEIGEDPLDPGGYFIVNGSERVIVGFEDLAPNRILVDSEKTGATTVYKAKIFSTTVGFRARIEAKMKGDGGIYVSIPGIPSELPFVVLMKALGVEEDIKIAEMVSLESEIQDELEASFEKASGIFTVKDALIFIGNRLAPGQAEEYRIKKAEALIDKNLFPHLGRKPENRFDKACFLAEVARRIIELKLKRRVEDDKDHYANKRLRLAGELLADLFRVVFRNLMKDLKYQLEKIYIKKRMELSIANAVRQGIITERIQHSIATGNWIRGKVGVTQLLDRTNYFSTLSHLRRLQSPLSRSQPNLEARDLHPTHWGRLCPNETPEGSNCGLVKNLALSSEISTSVPLNEVLGKLFRLGVIPIKEADKNLIKNGTKVIVDGIIIGYCSDPEALAKEIRKLRRSGGISPQVNVAYYQPLIKGAKPELYVNCDSGRVRRPLIIVENGKPKLTQTEIEKLMKGELEWNDLITQGFIEYLDADEEENALIAIDESKITEKTTHLEITPYTILGVCASLIPFAEHNQSPRNAYEAAMAKQALGLSSSNFFNRVDSRGHLLHYLQFPLVKTKPMELTKYFRRPAGQNCVVAVLSFQGYNMEDAIIISKSAIERGLFRSTFFRCYEGECRQYLGGLKDKFEIPEPSVRGFRGDKYYRLLEEDGVAPVEVEASGNEALIGRTSPPRFLEEYREFEAKGPTRRDSSICMRPSEKGIVDAVFITESIEGNKLIKVRVRDQRIPEIGDKFASRHGQKGVIGITVNQEDLPFTEDGIMPDIIINPHAFPSRMTTGQFIESIAGKVAALIGEPVDGTPFANDGVEALRRKLLKLGFQYSGKEVMYNGITGEKFEADIFIGVIYYQKLHHMVSDKIHARARGQVQMLTRQPTEGRARGGGLRFGEMERDCLIGHGASALLMDRLLEESDKTTVLICENCGFLAYHDAKQNKYVCRVCGDKASISTVTLSYAFKLLLQELMALGIAPRLKLEERA